MTVKELKEWLDKFPDSENVGFTVADVKDRKAWPNCEISSECLAGNRPMILLELHERFWNPTEEGKCNGMWIPIEERMPERNKSVLLCMKSRSSSGTCVQTGSYDNGLWFVQGAAGYESLATFEFHVLAWMPLPEPY